VALMNLKKGDVIVLSVGTNDVYGNNSKEALIKISTFIQNNFNTNIMILSIPHRHDLVAYSCLNKAIQSFNSTLKRVVKSFN
jgi:hypothetical protein